jgi:hypothetical protein
VNTTSPLPFSHRVARKVLTEFRNMKRRRLRLKVALCAPSPRPKADFPFTAHELVCHDDLLLAMCTAKAANLVLGAPLPWVFHDDGSLSVTDHALLRRHFPGTRVVSRAESDAAYDNGPRRFNALTPMRRSHVMLLKLADLHLFSNSPRILYCDSDVLFFNDATFIADRLHEMQGANYFNKDIATSYISDPATIEKLTGTRPLERINAGLSVLNRTDIALDLIDGVLTKLPRSIRNDWCCYDHLIEQTAVAVLASSSCAGARYLPPEYDLCFDTPLNRIATRHYVGMIRQRYELEGLQHLVNEKAFLERWTEFAAAN